MTAPFIEPGIIPGFKVMEWLRKVREDIHRKREENPEQYAAEMNQIREQMRRNVPLQDIVFGKIPAPGA